MINLWTRVHFPAGSVIFREGDIGDTAYLIERGRVEISVNKEGGEQVIATLGDGEMFGEIALMDKLPRSASATAIEDTTLIPISRDLVIKKVKNSDPLVAHLLGLVTGRYRSAKSGAQPNSDTLTIAEDATKGLREHALNQLKVAQGLSDALRLAQFQLYYQPIVQIADGALAGFEALIRWNKPDAGFVSPVSFIEVAEDTGLIIPIGRWVIGEAIAALGRLQAAMAASHPGAPRLFMSINLSTRQLQEPGEVDAIIALIRGTGADPHRIKLEVTESALIDDPHLAAMSLQKLKDLGLMLAIDDFGTGYSSLSYLGQYPLDTLKIDQSFVMSMQSNLNSLRITRAIASMAHDLEMDCIAEGVESEADLVILREIGCQYGQGYYFSKPRNEAQAIEYIQRMSRPAA